MLCYCHSAEFAQTSSQGRWHSVAFNVFFFSFLNKGRGQLTSRCKFSWNKTPLIKVKVKITLTLHSVNPEKVTKSFAAAFSSVKVNSFSQELFQLQNSTKKLSENSEVTTPLHTHTHTHTPHAHTTSACWGLGLLSYSRYGGWPLFGLHPTSFWLVGLFFFPPRQTCHTEAFDRLKSFTF
jgi:hypothetical protein